MANTGKRRVVVTGMGAITPVGNTLDTMWNNLISGKSGIGPNTLTPEEEITCRIAAICREFVPEDYMEKKEARRMDRYAQFAMAAAKLAYEHSGLYEGAVDPNRFGVVVSSAAGGIGTIEVQMKSSLEKGFTKCSPFLVPMMICDIAGGWIAIEYNAKGPNQSVVTACATGNNSIGDAFRMIQYGEADVIIAGGAEAPITSLSVAGFYTMRALSTRYDEPEKASRPFDKDRDGVDVISSIGIHRQVSGAFFAGIEAVGQDLEGFWETDEAEGGARLLVGPSLNFVPASSRFSFTLCGGPIIYATHSAPAYNEFAVRELPTSTGFTMKFNVGFRF